MRAYSASSEETLRARDLLKDWAGEGFLTEAQYRRVEQETACDLRRTNIFLRFVLFVFTLIIVGAAVALFFVVFLQLPHVQTTGIFLLIFAGISYAAAEFAVSKVRLYRHGIEEALAACSVGLLYVGIQTVWFSNGIYPGPLRGTEFLAGAAAALASLWIWYRFGLAYAWLAAMIFVMSLPGYWTPSQMAQHLIVSAFYMAGLVAIVTVRGSHRFTYLDQRYSIAEALLWLGIYFTINLKLSSVIWEQWWIGRPTSNEFPGTFYWATWMLIWCLPPVILARGVLLKDRFVIAVSVIATILTMVTNKPYLGWPRHSWDPMLLGALLIGVALFLRRWLADGPDGVRHGFTSRRVSGRDKHLMDTASMAAGFVLPHPITPSPQPATAEVQFGGGDSGGGGASSDF